MKVLDNTPAVLSLGKLCDENGYSYEWINGQKQHLIKDGIRIICNTENFVPDVFVKFIFWIVIDLKDTFETGESFFFIFFILIFFTYSRRNSGSNREDATNKDISPVPVSNLVDDGSGQPDEIQANKNPKPNKKETTIERGNPSDSEIPEWLQEFRENLVDGQGDGPRHVPQQAAADS